MLIWRRLQLYGGQAGAVACHLREAFDKLPMHVRGIQAWSSHDCIVSGAVLCLTPQSHAPRLLSAAM